VPLETNDQRSPSRRCQVGTNRVGRRRLVRGLVPAGSVRPGDLMRRSNASPRLPGKRRRPSKSARLEQRLPEANGREREVCFATFDPAASLSCAGFKQITSKATVRCRTYAARIDCGIPLTTSGCGTFYLQAGDAAPPIDLESICCFLYRKRPK